MNKENYITPQELSDYLPTHPKLSTIYVWVHKKSIPFVKFNNKEIFFEKEAIDKWFDSKMKRHDNKS